PARGGEHHHSAREVTVVSPTARGVRPAPLVRPGGIPAASRRRRTKTLLGALVSGPSVDNGKNRLAMAGHAGAFQAVDSDTGLASARAIPPVDHDYALPSCVRVLTGRRVPVRSWPS